MNALNTYRRTQNQTASKERLMALLFQTAYRHMSTAEGLWKGNNLKEEDFVEGETLLNKAMDIVIELDSTLNHSVAPELCQNLSDIYRFVIFRISKAVQTRQVSFINEAIRAFEPIAEAFTLAVEQQREVA